MSAKDALSFYLVCSFGLFLLGLLFYKNSILALCCCSLSLVFRKPFEKLCAENRRRLLAEEFKEVLYSISGAVAAGRQMPFAMKDALSQAEISFGKDADVCREFSLIVESYEQSHAKIEDLLWDFGKRSCIPEILHFASSYRVCKRNGGDLESVCLKSANLLIDRLDYRREIETLAAQKKLDIVLLGSLPVLILLFLNLVSSEYLEPMYSSRSGRIIMTICLLIMLFALYWAVKLTDLDL